jgi:hypothetical protein
MILDVVTREMVVTLAHDLHADTPTTRGVDGGMHNV